jgi:hypothetical protein
LLLKIATVYQNKIFIIGCKIFPYWKYWIIMLGLQNAPCWSCILSNLHQIIVLFFCCRLQIRYLKFTKRQKYRRMNYDRAIGSR